MTELKPDLGSLQVAGEGHYSHTAIRDRAVAAAVSALLFCAEPGTLAAFRAWLEDVAVPEMGARSRVTEWLAGGVTGKELSEFARALGVGAG
jgi:hypothetical protein